MNQKAMSLPSSPNEFRDQASDKSGPSDFRRTADSVSTWNKVLQSSSFLNKPLLPFQEWNVDFSELTVGARVGIGKLYSHPCYLFFKLLRMFCRLEKLFIVLVLLIVLTDSYNSCFIAFCSFDLLPHVSTTL